MVTSDDPKPWPTEDQDFEFQFGWTMENVGKSPAFVTKISIDGGVRDLPIPNRRPKYGQSEYGGRLILAPGGKHRGGVAVPFQKEIEDVMNGKKCVVFSGCVYYWDTGWRCHRTRFFFWWYRKDGEIWTSFLTGPTKTIKYT